MQDIFYDTIKLTLKQKNNLLIEAKKLSYEWWVEILDCTKSFHRKKIEMLFDEILIKLTNKSHFVIIHRKINEEMLEIGFSTMEDPSYFLWIYCHIEHLKYFIEKYNLNER